MTTLDARRDEAIDTALYQDGFNDGYIAATAKAEEQQKRLVEALGWYAHLKKTIWEPCSGSHVMYSSMHPLADVSCKICGQTEDGLGGEIRKEMPDPLGDKARAALAAYDEKK